MVNHFIINLKPTYYNLFTYSIYYLKKTLNNSFELILNLNNLLLIFYFKANYL